MRADFPEPAIPTTKIVFAISMPCVDSVSTVSKVSVTSLLEWRIFCFNIRCAGFDQKGATIVSSSDLPRWDLSNVYPSLESEELRKGFADLKTQIDELDAFLDEHRVSRTSGDSNQTGMQLKPTVEGYLDRTNASLRLYSTINAYVASFVTTDSYNTTAKRLESEVRKTQANVGNQT